MIFAFTLPKGKAGVCLDVSPAARDARHFAGLVREVVVDRALEANIWYDRRVGRLVRELVLGVSPKFRVKPSLRVGITAVSPGCRWSGYCRVPAKVTSMVISWELAFQLARVLGAARGLRSTEAEGRTLRRS